MNECKTCGKPDAQKPMAFRGEKWCSEIHRKQQAGEIKLEKENTDAS